jgi:hypothetical protein
MSEPRLDLPRDQHGGFGDRPYETPHGGRRRPKPAPFFAGTAARGDTPYVELHAHSAYSFLRARPSSATARSR